MSGDEAVHVSTQIQTSSKFTDPRYFATNPKMEYAFIVSVLLGQVFTQAASNAALPLLQVLTKFYDSNAGQTTWFMSSFSLAQGALILISGRIGDIYGLRYCIVGGYAWTLVWSILCGVASLSTKPTFFIVCRAMCGAGMAFVLPNVMGAAGRVYRSGSRRKHMIFSLIGLSAPLGGGLGPIFNGLIATYTTQWAWCFYHYSIAVAIVLVLAYFSIPEITPYRKLNPEITKDWIGSALGVCALVLFNFTWNQGPIAGWNSAYIIVLLVISVILIVAFFWYEKHIPKNPLVPRKVMEDITLSLSLLALFLSWGSFGILFYRFFKFVEELRGYDPLQAGACMTPVIVFGMVAALCCGFLISRVKACYIFLFSLCMFVISDAVMAVTPVHQTFFKLTLCLWIIAVFGQDMSFPAIGVILSDNLPAELQGMSGSLLNTMVMYGMSLALGIHDTVEIEVGKRTGGNLLSEHRACMYFALGLSSSAVVVGVIVTFITVSRDRRRKRHDDESIGSESSAQSDVKEELPVYETSQNAADIAHEEKVHEQERLDADTTASQ